MKKKLKNKNGLILYKKRVMTEKKKMKIKNKNRLILYKNILIIYINKTFNNKKNY